MHRGHLRATDKYYEIENIYYIIVAICVAASVGLLLSWPPQVSVPQVSGHIHSRIALSLYGHELHRSGGLHASQKDMKIGLECKWNMNPVDCIDTHPTFYLFIYL